MTNIIDLSQELYNLMPVYPGDPECKVEEIHTIEKEGWRLKYLQMSTHIGTHADAFSHMDKSGKSLSDLPIEKFIGECMLCSLEEDFPSNIGLAFSNGTLDLTIFEKLKNAKPTFVVVGNTAVLDVELERALLQSGILTITDLVNMENLPKRVKFRFFGVPLKIRNGDGSPIRAFAILD